MVLAYRFRSFRPRLNLSDQRFDSRGWVHLERSHFKMLATAHLPQVADESVGAACTVGDAVVLAFALTLTDSLLHLLDDVHRYVHLLQLVQKIVDDAMHVSLSGEGTALSAPGSEA